MSSEKQNDFPYTLLEDIYNGNGNGNSEINNQDEYVNLEKNNVLENDHQTEANNKTTSIYTIKLKQILLLLFIIYTTLTPQITTILAKLNFFTNNKWIIILLQTLLIVFLYTIISLILKI